MVNNTVYPVKKLGEVVTLKRGRFGHRPRNEPRFYGGKYPFIQTGNIVEASKTIEPIKYSQTLNELGLQTSRLFQPNVLVITIAANIGDTAILDYPACFPDSLVALIPKTDINIYYLNFYLRFLKPYIENLAPQAAQRNINNQQLSPIPVVIPPRNIQDKIVKIFTRAYSQKQRNESNAEELLKSIDTYLLSELGIKFPEKPIGIKSRMFTRNFSEITGKRLDPFHNQLNFAKTIQTIHKGKYKVQLLKDLIIDLKNGVEIRDYVQQGGVRYLRVTDLDKIGLNNDSPRYVLEQDVPEKIKLNKNCILISRSGSLGLVNVVDSEIENSILSSHIFKVELRTDKILPHYLEAYLRSPLGQSEILRNNNGGVIPEINQQALKSIFVPVPPIEVQQEILKHINDIRNQIKRLNREGFAILEDAKKEVEKMILG